MISYRTDVTDPYFNLAMEEYLIDTAGDEEIFILWRNEPSVIIGRNQNAFSELDVSFAREHDIKVVRRLTGGGAVFHDLGNINYTFISPDVDGGSLNFARFCEPIVRALRALGLDASLSGRNDILAEGRKVSGTAQCVRSGHVMHHGTLLWDADFSAMAGVLRPDTEKLAAKGIKSVRSRVGNIRALLAELGDERQSDVTVPDSVLGLGEYLYSSFPGEPVPLSERQLEEIGALADAKYRTWNWNFGSSKQYAAEKRRRFPFGSVCVRYTLSGGIIEEIDISGDFFGAGSVQQLCSSLVGTRCERDALLTALDGRTGEFILGATDEDIADLLG